MAEEKWKVFWFDGNFGWKKILNRSEWDLFVYQYSESAGESLEETITGMLKIKTWDPNEYCPSFSFKKQGGMTLKDWAKKNKIDLGLPKEKK